MIKKNLLIGCCLTIGLMLAGCGDKEVSNQPTTTQVETTTEEKTSSVEEETTTEDEITSAVEESTSEDETTSVEEETTSEEVTTEAPTQAPTEAPTEAPTQAPTQAPTTAKKESVYATIITEGDFVRAEPGIGLVKITDHNAMKPYRDIIDSIKIGGELITSIGNNYSISSPFDLSYTKYIDFQILPISESEIDTYTTPYMGSVVSSCETTKGTIYLHYFEEELMYGPGDVEIRKYYQLRYSAIIDDKNTITNYYPHHNYSNIIINMYCDFEGTTKEQAEEDMQQIQNWINQLEANPGLNIVN